MPLDPASLADAIRQISDPTHPNHAWPASPDEAADRWAVAVSGYLGQRAGPQGLPGADVAALVAFRQAFAEALPGGGLAALQAGSVAAAALLASLTPPPAIAVPPPAPPVLPPSPPSADPAGAADRLAQAIHTWAVTGTWTPGPPTPPGPWA